jgi:hypothetical protein
MSDHVSFTDLMAQAEKEGMSFENVPIGPYEMYVKSAKAGRTANGKLRLEATLAIIGGPYDGKTVWNQFVISPENGKALGFFFRHMAILGAGIEWFKPRQLNEPTIAELAQVVLGSRCFCKVGIANVNNADRNSIDDLKPSTIAPGQKYQGAGGPTAQTAMVPNVPAAGAPPIPSVATLPQSVPVPQGAAPAPEQPAAPAAPPAQPTIPVGTTADIGGVQHVYDGQQETPPQPATAGAAPAPAPKAPF